jgi:hypothetical protein
VGCGSLGGQRRGVYEVRWGGGGRGEGGGVRWWEGLWFGGGGEVVVGVVAWGGACPRWCHLQ